MAISWSISPSATDLTPHVVDKLQKTRLICAGRRRTAGSGGIPPEMTLPHAAFLPPREEAPARVWQKLPEQAVGPARTMRCPEKPVTVKWNGKTRRLGVVRMSPRFLVEHVRASTDETRTFGAVVRLR